MYQTRGASEASSGQSTLVLGCGVPALKNDALELETGVLHLWG